jgi:hypothetical protein
MTKYLLLRLPGVLLVFGFLIIVHYMQFSVFPPKNRMGALFNKISAESFDVFIVSTEEKRVSKDLIESIVHQKDVEVKVHVLDLSGDLNFGNSEKVDYKRCASLELMDFFHKEVLSIDPSHIVVVIDPLEKKVHPYLLQKIKHLFQNREVKAVYSDRKVKPTHKRPGWGEAKIKAYHVGLAKHLEMEKIHTLEDYHAGILFLSDESFLFSSKVLDPDPSIFD